MNKKLLIIGLIIVLFGGSFFIVNRYSSSNKSISNITPTNITKDASSDTTPTLQATDFTLKDLSGKSITLSSHRGKNVYLNFWASWCSPCKAEMPDIEKLYQETIKSDLVILGVNLGEDKATVGTFISNHKYHFSILLDSAQSVAAKYNITAIPSSFFINKNGNIIGQKLGEMTISEMKSYISQLK